MKCNECIHENEDTGSCMSGTVTEAEVGTDNCSGFEQKTPELGPEDMFKALYMTIFSLGGEISIPKKSFDKFADDMKILPSYDAATKRFILETSFKPPAIKRKRGIIKLNKQVIGKRDQGIIMP